MNTLINAITQRKALLKQRVLRVMCMESAMLPISCMQVRPLK